jgi:hypothetical protein
MTRFFFSISLFLLVWCADLRAQTGSQDSVLGGQVRPRRETYIIESYPSPVRVGQVVNISYYNHNQEELSLCVVDVNDKIVKELHPRKLTPNGVHKYELSVTGLATGAYFVRLKTYSSTGSLDKTQDSRFLVIR